MQGLGSAARTNCSLTELPSGIYALQAKRTTLDHPVWQQACSNNEKKRRGGGKGGWGGTQCEKEAGSRSRGGSLGTSTV